MHGRRRQPLGHVPDSKEQSKGAKLKSLLLEVLKNHHDRCYTKNAMKQSARLLEINPEMYTAWNYRKLAVQHLLESEPDEASSKLVAEEELRLVERALRVNVKSYGAWYHRKWIIRLGMSSLDYEFMLLKKLLKDDPRNFLGWDYRRFAVKFVGVPAEKELDYTTEKINENFSNYSAWHYRSTLLSQLMKGEVQEALKNEYKLVSQAFFTEPDDQTAWFYNSWLLEQTRINDGAHLIGIWPPAGSTVNAYIKSQGSKLMDVYQNSSETRQRLDTSVPIILCFSKPIMGLNATLHAQPRLEGLSGVSWKAACSPKGPSNFWTAEIPLPTCAGSAYSILVQISSEPGAVVATASNFILHVMSSEVQKDIEIALQGGEHTSSSKIVENVPLVAETPGRNTVAERAYWQQNFLDQQVGNIRALLEIEPNSKFAKLTLARILAALNAHMSSSKQIKERLSLYEELRKIDNAHGAYYDAQLSLISLDESTNNSEQLWGGADRAHQDDFEPTIWLRFSGKSLSRFGHTEKYLGVQRLDLSHNRLSTLEGLQGLMLLMYLDVSYNQLQSVTSLASISRIPCLLFLDISFNEIGDHSVDCSRYSFPSLLTHQVLEGMTVDRAISESMPAGCNWETKYVFGSMHLRVLNVAGNAAATSSVFIQTLKDALPSLEWLNDEKISL